MPLSVLIESPYRELLFAPVEVMMAGIASMLIAALVAGVGRVLTRKNEHHRWSYVVWLFLGAGISLCILALVLMAFDDRPRFQ